MEQDSAQFTAMQAYILSILEQKNAKISERTPVVGDFIFDYHGDLIGFYQGKDRIYLIAKSINDEQI